MEMLPFRSYHGYQTWSDLSSTINGQDSLTTSTSNIPRKSTDANRNHKEAERRRRQRINAHLSTLRTLLPNTTKTDKASLLAEVVQHVRELKTQIEVMEVGQYGGGWTGCYSGSELERSSWPFPGDADEASLSFCGVGGEEERRVKATICCEDRPSLNRDLNRAIKSVRGRMIRVEMMTVGGRTKSEVVMQWGGGGGGGGGDEEIQRLKRALNGVVENRGSGCGLERVGLQNKRVRTFRSVGENE